MSFLVLAPVLLTAVLVVSGVMKLRRPEESAAAFTSLALPKWLDQPFFHKALPVGELLLAVALLVLPSPLSVGAAGAALVLMLLYVIVIARALRFPYPVDCACFGDLGLGAVSQQTLYRNLLLSLVGVGAVAFAVTHSMSPAGALLGADLNTWGWLLGVAVAVTLTGFIVGVGGSAVGGEAAGAAHEHDDPSEAEEGEYLRAPIPALPVMMIDGSVNSLRAMARQQAQLLVYMAPRCGHCDVVLRQFEELRGRLGPVMLREVYAIEPALGKTVFENGEVPDPQHALFDPGRIAITALELGVTPSAVLLGADGLLAGGPVYGASEVIDFIEDVITQLEEAGAMGEPASDA